MWCSKVSLLFAVAITIANGLPNTFQCSRYCKESFSSKFGYTPGKTYRYKYDGSITTTVNPLNPTDTATVNISTYADIYMMDSCNFALKASDTKLVNVYSTSSGPENIVDSLDSLTVFKNRFEKNVLFFSYQHGRIDNICHSSSDTEDILNIKRGIISSFQNSAQNIQRNATVYESDITGNCETRYELIDRSDENETTLKKTKSMDRCNHRIKKNFSWQSVPYVQKQTGASQPLLRSSQECLQTYNFENQLKESICRESHKFQPFSHGSSGATSQLIQTMTLVLVLDINPGIKLPLNIVRSSLIFAEAQVPKKSSVNLSTVLVKLDKIEENTKDGIKEEVPLLFSELVQDFNNLENNDLLSLFEQIENNVQQKKFFLDAISLVTTPSSIKVLIDLYGRDKITTSQMKSFISSVSFISTPTIDTLENAKELLYLNEDTKQQALLAVSSLLYKFCSGDNSCYDNDIISGIMDFMIKPVISNNCIPTSADNLDTILLSIKAIGNAGLNTPMEALKICYANSNSPVELRLAAIVAHQRIPCQFKMNNLDDFTYYLANPHENTELRITSYIASMQCLSSTLFSQVKDILLREETNQVGSFIWTHLTNLQETSVQWKQSARRLLENDFLRNKFHTDMRKYSRNYEASSFFDSIGAGAGVESNIIFTQDSYLPKSAMVNLTLDLFGESINLFEFGGRMEGFEDIIENLFGAEGYFPEKSIQNLLQTVRGQHEESTKEKIRELGDAFMEQKTLKRDPNAMVYAKIFGNEVGYYRFKELSELSEQMMTPNDIAEVIMKLLRENSVNYTKSLLLMKSSLKVPTLLGMPLELSVDATSTVGLSIQTKLDLKDLWAYKMAAEGKIYPSVSIAVVGNMLIHSPINKCGLRMLSTLNSNTFIDGHVFINSGKIIDLKINMPNNATDILRVESNIFVVQIDALNEEYAISEPIQDASDNTYDRLSCTDDNFGTVTGVQLCYNVKYVNASTSNNAPYFPLTGAFKYGITIKKTDVFDSYDFKLKIQNSDSNGNPIYFMSVYADTPNSLISRQMKASYNLDYQQMYLNAKLFSPLVRLEINSKVGDDNSKYGFFLRTTYNENEMISIQSSFKVVNVDKLMKYEPYATVNFRRKEIAAITGTISYVKDAQYNADLKLKGITEDPVNVVGEMSYDSENLDVKAILTSNLFNGKIAGAFQKKSNSLAVVTSCLYNFNNTLAYESLHFTFKMNQVRLGTLSKDAFFIEFTSSEKPTYDTLLSLNSQRSKMYFDSSGIFKIFGTTWETNQLLKYQQPKNYLDMAIMCSLACKETGIDYKIVLAHASSESEFTIHTLIQLSSIQRVEAIISYEEHLPEKRAVYVLFYYPRNTWTINGTLNEISANTHDIFVTGVYESDTVKRNIISITGEYSNSSTAEKQQYTLTSAIDLPASNGIWNTPWNLTTFIDISNERFYCMSQFVTMKTSYFSKIDWTDKIFYSNINKDTKNLLLVDTENNEEKMKFLVGVNIYQHFEVGMVLVKPNEAFNFKFYWDKYRDEDQRLSLDLKKDVIHGLYLMCLEYPHQIIGASVILLPTQVTMNVTWGVEISKRLYLKVGNEIYDESGIWFGELETPFEYLEKQKFRAKYFVLPNRFKVETDVSWRDHYVNGVLSGSKGPTNLTGHFEVITTLKEMNKIGALFSYGHRLVGNNPLIEGDAKFVYNNDEITAKTMWRNRGLNVDATLEVVSPTDTIQPITSGLVIKNLDKTSTMESYLTYQGKRISAQYSFENTRSFVKIITPFQGIEEMDFEYAIVVDRNELVLEVTLNLFKQLNHGLLLFNNTEDAMNVKLNVTSPVTGAYMATFKHSNRLGYLDEQFMVTHGEDSREIANISISGSIIPLLDTNVLAHIKILNNVAALLINNNRLPQISSDILLRWNEYDIASFLTVSQTNQVIHDLKWVLRSSLLDNNIKCHYKKSGDIYTTSLNLLNECDIVNSFSINQNYTKVQNNLSLITAANRYHMAYEHSLSLRKSIVSLNITNNKQHLYTNMNYNYNSEVCFVDNANFNLMTSWHDPVTFHFEMGKENLSRFKPVVRIWLGKYYQFNIESVLHLDTQSSSVTLAVNATNIIPINIEASYNFTNNRKLMEMSMKEDNLLVTVLLDLLVEKEHGYSKINVASNKYGNLTDTILSYDFSKPKKEIFANIKLPYLHREVVLKSCLENGDQTINATIDIITNIKSMEIVTAKVLFAKEILANYGFIQFKLADHDLNWNYNINEIKLPNKFVISSNLRNDFYNESNFNLSLSLDKSWHSRTINMTFNSYIYEIVSEGGYNFERKSDDNDNTRTKMNTHIEIKCTKYKRDNILDLKINMLGSLHRTDNSGGIDIKFLSNMPKLENVEMATKYELEKNSYAVGSEIRYLAHEYKFHHTAKLYEQILRVEFNVQSKDDLNKHIHLIISGHNKDNKYETNIEFTHNAVKYTIDVHSDHDLSELYFGNSISITTPLKETHSSLVIKGLGFDKYVRINAPIDDKKNDINWTLNVTDMLDFSLNLYTNLEYFDLIGHNITLKTDVNKVVKEIHAQYEQNSKDKYLLNTIIDESKLSLKIATPSNDQFVFIYGEHYIEPINITLRYNLQYDKYHYGVHVMSYDNDYTQTKLEFRLGNRRYGMFETKMDDDKIRVSLSVPRHYMSALVLRKSFFIGRDVILIEYNGEPLFVVTTRPDQTIVSTTSKYGIYRMTVSYMSFPRIWTFSILKNGDNFISLAVHDNSNDSHVDIKGRLMAPQIFKNYPILSIQYKAEKIVSNFLHFAIMQANKPLIYVGWVNKVGPNVINSWFKFQFPLDFMQDFEQHLTILQTTALAATYDLTTLRYNKKQEFAASLQLPKNKSLQDVSLNIMYPCATYTNCSLNFQSTKSRVHFYWSSPYDNWKNVTISARLDKDGLIRNGQVHIEKNAKYLKLNWSSSSLQDRGLGQFQMSNNGLEILKDVAFNLEYLFNRSLKGSFTVNGATSELDVVIENTSTNKTIRASLISQSVLIQQCNFLLSLIQKSNTNYAISSAFILDNRDIFELNTLYDSDQANEDNSFKVYLNIDSNRLLEFSTFYKPQKNHTELVITMDCNLNTSLLTFISEPIIFNANLDASINNTDGSLKISKTNKFLQYLHTKNDENYIYTANWTIKREPNLLAGEIILNNNGQLFFTSLKHRNNVTNFLSHFKLLTSMRTTEILIESQKSLNRVSGNVLIDTPIFETILFKSEITHDLKSMESIHQLGWGVDQRIKIVMNSIYESSRKYLNLNCSTTFSEMLFSKLEYQKITDGHDLILHSSYGQKELYFHTYLIPQMSIKAEIATPFPGYTTATFSAGIDKLSKTVEARFEKETLLAEFNGTIDMVTNNIHEAHLVIKNPTDLQNETIAHAIFKLDRENMKGFVRIYWVNDLIDLGVIYNPAELSFKLKSDLESIKNITLIGKYQNDINDHVMKAEGEWNEIPIKFSGKLKFEANNTKTSVRFNIGSEYEGEFDFAAVRTTTNRIIDFHGFYPDSQSNAYFKYDRFNNGSDAVSNQLVIKTPFVAYSNININSKTENGTMSLYIIGNIGNKDFVSYNKLSRLNGSFVEATASISIPSDEIKWCLEAKFNATQNGELRFYKMNEDISSNATISYERNSTFLIINFDKYTAEDVKHESLIIIHKNTPNILYSVSIRGYKLMADIKYQDGKLSFAEANARVPYYGLEDLTLTAELEQDYKNQSLFMLNYNNNSLKICGLNIFQHATNKELAINVTSPLYKFKSELELNKTEDGFRFGLITKTDEKIGSNMSILYLNNDKIFNINSICVINDVINSNEMITIHKNLDKIYVSTNSFVMSYLKSDESLGYYLMYNNTASHYIFFNLSPKIININYHTPLFDMEEVKILLDVTTSNPSLYIYSGGLMLLNGKVTSTFSNNYTKCEVNAKFVFLETDIYLINSILTNADSIDGEITFTDADMNDHTLRIVYSTQDHFIAGIDLLSYYLPDNGFTIHTHIQQMPHFTFFVGCTELDTKQRVLLRVVSEKEPHNYRLKVEVPTSRYLRTVALNVNWSFDDAYQLHQTLDISSEIIGEVHTLVDYTADESGLFLNTDLQLPFMEHFEKFQALLELPKHFRPKFEITLPNGKSFGLHFAHTISCDVIIVKLGYHCDVRKFDFHADLKFSEYKVLIEAIVPSQLLQYLKISINVIENAEGRVHTLAYNNKNYEIVHNFINNNDQKVLSVLLTTPHEGYDKYFVDLEWRMYPDKLIRAWIYNPDLEKPIGFSFAMSFYNAFTFKMKSAIVLPLPVYDIDYFELSILDELSNTNSEGILYVLECSSKSNLHNMSINVDAVDIAYFRQLLIGLNINQDTFVTNIVSIGPSIDDLRFFIDLNTTYLDVGHVNIFLNSSIDLQRGIQSGIMYNKEDIINFNFRVKERLLQIIVKNLWKPVSLEYKYVNELGEFSAIGVVCYNLFAKNTSTLGGIVIVTNNITTRLYLPSRTMSFVFQKTRNNSKAYYLSEFSWNNNDTLSLELFFVNKTIRKLTNLHHSAILQFPFNRFEVLQVANINFDHLSMNTTNKFIWGLEKSEMCLTNKLEPGKLQSRLKITPLEHDIILNVDISKFHTIPSLFKASMQYSNDLNKRIELEMFYNKKVGPVDYLATERMFIFKHPASKINHTLYFSTIKSNEYTNGSSTIRYHNYELDKEEILQTSICVWHEKFKLKGDLETSHNTISISAEATNERDKQTLQLLSQVNNKEPLLMECFYDYSKASPSISVKASYGSAKRYDLYLGLPSNKEIKTQLQHDIYDDNYVDALFTLKLNSSQLLWVKIQWANELVQTFHSAIMEEYGDLRYIAEATGKQLIDIIDDNIGKILLDDLKSIKQNVTVYYERKLLTALDGRLTRYIINNYNQNAFYSKRIQSLLTYLKEYKLFERVVETVADFIGNIYSTLTSTWSHILHSIKTVVSITSEIVEAIVEDISDVKNLKANTKQLLKHGITKARKSLKDMEEVAIDLLNQLNESIDNFRLDVETFFHPCLMLLDEFIQYIEAQLTIVQIALMGTMDTIQKYLSNLREMKELIQVYLAYINWLEDLHISTVLEPIGDILEKILDTIIRDVKKIIKHYKPYIEAVTEATFGNYDGVKNLPQVAEIKETVNRFYQKTIWIWNYNNVTDLMKSTVHKMSADLDDCLAYILDYDNSPSTDFEYVVGQAGYMIKPEAGLIEIAQPLPVEWEAFDKWPKFEQHYAYKKIMRKLDQLEHIFRYRYGDIIHVLLSYIDDLRHLSLSLPINNIAFIAGSSHFITFNGKHYDFIGEHSYLLASDFAYNSFSIAINYEPEQTTHQKHSLIVHIKDHIVEIYSNYTVTLNSAKVDLPIILDGGAYVLRDKDNVIVEFPKKFHMYCNMRFDYCIIQLTGWLFGKTAGLLGTMDNEIESDLLLPNGNRTKDLDEFTTSWRIRNHPAIATNKTESKAKEISPLQNLMVNNICALLFEDRSSPLFNCFQKVDPKPFYKLCVTNVQNNPDPNLCVSIAVYKEVCWKEKILFEIPHVCRQCEANGKIIGGNEEIILDGHNPESVDVIFVKQANCEKINFDLNNLPTILDNAFNSRGFTNNRYAFIIYGTDVLNKPYVRTYNSQIWTNARSIQITSNSDIYESIKHQINSVKLNAITAINYVTDNLNFRPGVTTMIVLLHCGQNLEIQNSAEIFTKLSDKDVILHVLKSKPFVDNHAQVFGLNANGYVININAAIEKTNKTAEIIDNVRDMHNELALGTNGTVADIDCFIERPNFKDSWAELVSQSLRRSPCQRCRCTEGADSFGKIECVRCISPAVKRFIDEYELRKPKFLSDSTHDTDGTTL